MQPALGLDAPRPPGDLGAAHEPGARADEQEREQHRAQEDQPGAPALVREEALAALDLDDELARPESLRVTLRRGSHESQPRSHRTRGVASVVLVVLGAALLLAGRITFYLRTRSSTRTLSPTARWPPSTTTGVRRVVGREIVVNLIDRGSTDLVAARPLLESVVDAVIAVEAVQDDLPPGGDRGQPRLLRPREAATRFRPGRRRAAGAVRAAVGLARAWQGSCPRTSIPTLLALRRREFAGQTLAIADAGSPARHRACRCSRCSCSRRRSRSRPTAAWPCCGRASRRARPAALLARGLLVLRARAARRRGSARTS